MNKLEKAQCTRMIRSRKNAVCGERWNELLIYMNTYVSVYKEVDEIIWPSSVQTFSEREYSASSLWIQSKVMNKHCRDGKRFS